MAARDEKEILNGVAGRLILEQAPAIIWTTDRELRITSSSGAALQHLNLAPGEVVGMLLSEFFQTRDLDFPPIAAHVRALAGMRVSFEQAWAGKHYSAHVEPLRDASGDVIGCVGVALETQTPTELNGVRTSRRPALPSAPPSNPMLAGFERASVFQEYLRSARIGIAITSPEKDLLECNDYLCEMLGRPREDLMQLAWPEWTHPDDVADDIDQFERLLRCEIDYYSLDKRYLRPDGNVVHAMLSVQGVRNAAGSLECVVAIVQDISARKRAEESLLKAKEELDARIRSRTEELERAHELLQREMAERSRVENELQEQHRILDRSYRQLAESEESRDHQASVLRSVLNSIADGVVAADRRGEFVIFNPAAVQMIGIEAAHIPPDKWADYFGLFLPDRMTPYPAEMLPLRRAMCGETVSSVELFVRNDRLPHGRLISINAQPMLDAHGTILGGVAVFRDVSELHHMTDMLHRRNRLLKQVLDVQERERRLIAYEIHDGIVQQMTGALLHLAAVDSASFGSIPRAANELKIAVQLVRASVDEARQLISGLRPPVLDDLGIIAAIDYLVNETRRSVPDVDYHHHASTERLSSTTENAIFRIIQEALNNVRQHSEAKRASVELFEHLGFIRIKVRDWGKGFDPARVSGERFGLQGMRERGRLLGTKVLIESAPGKGSIVVADIPILSAQEPDA